MKYASFIIVLGILLAPITPLYSATFDPNFIISDADMVNEKTMDTQAIQNFLTSKQSPLAGLTFVDIDGITRSAADIIYLAARENQINPRVLLVLLQKEQSLITDKTPSQKQLDWATGYAVCDNCSFNDPKVIKYKGFPIQVRNAAGLFRYYYDNVTDTAWIKRRGGTYTIDGGKVSPLSHATAFLYTFTPHIEGNKNFWSVWNDWFKGQAYPDGVIVQVPGDPRAYYLEGGKKRMANSIDIIRTYYGDQTVIRVTQSDLDVMPDGTPIRFHNYAVIHTDDDATYLNVDGILHPFASKEALRALGFNPDETIEAKTADVAGYEKSTFITVKSAYPTGAILKGRTSGALFYVRNGIKYRINDLGILSTNYNDQKPAIIKDSALNDYIEYDPIAIQNGSLVQAKGVKDAPIYLVSNSVRRLIPDSATFKSLGFSTDDVVLFTADYLKKLPEGDPLTLSSLAH